jgi:hypothetical protein
MFLLEPSGLLKLAENFQDINVLSTLLFPTEKAPLAITKTLRTCFWSESKPDPHNMFLGLVMYLVCTTAIA